MNGLWGTIKYGIALAMVVGVFSAPPLASAATPTLSPVPGSPFWYGGSSSEEASGVAFSPNGHYVASSDFAGQGLSVFAVNGATGALTLVPGSPFATGGAHPTTVAFNPQGSLLAVSNYDSGNVSVFRFNSSTGAPTQVAGSPFTVGSGAPNPQSVAFGAGGGLLAIADGGTDTVSIYSVNQSTGALTEVTGSPFALPGNTVPAQAVFNPSSSLLAVTLGGPGNPGAPGNSVVMFQVNTSTGALTQVGTSVPTGGTGPQGASFSPDGRRLAVGNGNSANVSVFTVSPAGTLTPTPGSPFGSSGTSPDAIAFAPDGSLLAAASGSTGMPVFSDNQATGVLSQLSGSPFPNGGSTGPGGVAFSPNGKLIAGANYGAGGITMYQVAFPAAQPVLGKSFNAQAVSGRVRIKLPHTKSFKRLSGTKLLPVGTAVDASAGTARVVTATTHAGQFQNGLFYKGQFILTQSHNGVAQAKLSAKLKCGGAHHAARLLALTARRHSKPRHIHLWGNTHGHFKTSTRNGSAITVGTKWLTDETCTGTRFTVKRGVVKVTDFKRHRTVVVHAGHSYLAGR